MVKTDGPGPQNLFLLFSKTEKTGEKEKEKVKKITLHI